MSRIIAVYLIRTTADQVEQRAEAIAIEQSVEMPLAAIMDDHIHDRIVGRVESIEPKGPGLFEARIALAAETVGPEAGQFMSMVFGNVSLMDEVTLIDVVLPEAVALSFGGPRQGVEGLRRRAGAEKRAMTCTAIKPQGLPPKRLAEIAYAFALGGVDFIKDDHGIAEQAYSPFAERVAACAAAVRRGAQETGRASRYVPHLSGHLDSLRRQMAIARDEGVDTVMVAPMMIGFPAFHELVRTNPDIAFLAHPTMGGASRIAAPALFGRLYRLFGADSPIFTNYGGRFAHSPETCRQLADTARAPWHGLKPAMPVPAGGMTVERVGELLDFYGSDVMLLIGGSLLLAKEELAAATASFVQEVERHSYP